ncbi:tetratricopeptide repeat protein [Streptomyces sp. NPDC054932]
MAERLLLDIDIDGRATVSAWPAGESFPSPAGQPARLAWPLDSPALEDLRWYLEEYLRVPFGVYGDRGRQITDRLPAWGAEIFEAVFGSGPARDAYQRARARAGRVELVIRSDSAQHLAMPWELMADPARPSALALDGFAVSRSLLTAKYGDVTTAAGRRLRVLMVISRPRGPADVGYQLIARPLLARLAAVRGSGEDPVELVVLRPPTLERLAEVLAEAREAGEPFQIVHFDGHGVFGDPTAAVDGGTSRATSQGAMPQGMLAFEKPGGGADLVPAGRVAQVLAHAGVHVVVLNACQSGTVGSEVEAAVATRLLQEGTPCVVAMAYSVYAVAAAEFMAAFYERLFAGDRVTEAVAAGRRRMARSDSRPSPKGKLPLADWMVPVLYTRRDVHFPDLRNGPEATGPVPDGPLDLREGSDQDDDLDDLRGEGDFVGRDALCYTLDVATRLQRVVVLHGPAGTGKTELARAFGRWARDTGATDDPAGVIWHSFEPGAASFGLESVVDAVALRDLGAQAEALDPAKRLAHVHKLLASRRMLLIWDNFESVHSMPDPTGATPPLAEEGRAELRAFLSKVARGRSTILVTSRTDEKWLGDFRSVAVGGLDPDEANQYADLLLAPYPQAQTWRAHQLFGELMQWLDGHPLSMRLVLPHLDTDSPKVLLDALRGTEALPESAGSDRTQSLAASIGYSFAHLPVADRRVLVVLSLLQGAADAALLGAFSETVQAPERFRGLDADDWEGVLRRAGAVGLLVRGAVSHRIHPALPAYLAERWSTEALGGYRVERGAALRALAYAYEGAGYWLIEQLRYGDAGSAMVLIAEHRRTMGSLLGQTLKQQQWAEALAIAQPLNHYLGARGLTEENRLWADRAMLAVESPNGDAPTLDTPAGEVWLHAAQVLAIQNIAANRMTEAERTYLGILEAAGAYHQGDPDQARLLGVTLHQLGVVARRQGRPAKAEAWFCRALDLKVRNGDRAGEAVTRLELGTVALDQGRPEQAAARYGESLEICCRVGDRHGEAQALHQLGRAAQDQGEPVKAAAWYRESLAIREQLGDRVGAVAALYQLGRTAEDLGRLAESEEMYRRSLVLSEEIGDHARMASIYHQLGNLAFEQGRTSEAENWYRSSLKIREDIGDHTGTGGNYHQLGVIAQAQGQLAAAQKLLRCALDIHETAGNPIWLAATYGQLALLAEERNEQREALEWAVKGVALIGDLSHPAIRTHLRDLHRLTKTNGIRPLKQAWRAVTGQRLPLAVRAFVRSRLPDPAQTGDLRP